MTGERQIVDGIRAEFDVRVEAAIADLATRQHGVVSREQLEALGVGRGAIQWRLRNRRLHRVHQNVYAVGHRDLSAKGRWMAAVLATGWDGALSHRSAGALHGIRATSRSRIELTSPRRHSRPGLEVHQATLAGAEVAVVDAIRVTTTERTLLDLAGVIPAGDMERAVERADALRLIDHAVLEALVARNRGRRGVARLRGVLGAYSAPVVTRSKLEDRFLSFLDDYGIPHGEVNADIRLGERWIEVDMLWRRQRVIVELDSRAWHDTGVAYERDRERDRALQARGWRVVRVTWRQLHEDPAGVARDLSAILANAKLA